MNNIKNMQQKDGNFELWVKNMNDDDPINQLDSTLNLRRLLSLEINPPIQQVVESGVVKRLIEFLTYHDNPRLQFEATWAITNITSGTSEQTNFVINQGAIPHIINLLKSTHVDIVEQAVWALGNIAGDSYLSRDMLINHNVIDNILPLISQQKILRTVTWMVSNLCRGKPAPSFEKVYIFIDPLSILIESSTDLEIVCDALWALSYLSDGPSAQIQVVIDKGICKKVSKFLATRDLALTTPALRIFGNVFSGTDIHTQYLLDMNILSQIVSFLFSSKKALVKESCWIISNITAGNPEQLQEVINLNVFPVLIDIMNNGDYELKKEACTAVSNASFKGNKQQLDYLFNIGVLFPVCNLCTSQDTIIALTCLECIENFLKINDNDEGVSKCVIFLEENGFVDKLQELGRSENENISIKSNNILSAFFKSDLEEED